MRLARHYLDLAGLGAAKRVVSIGNFDGVHVGHRAVLAAARAEAERRGVELAVLTFEPHPAELFGRAKPRMRLADPEQKTALLAACGVDLALFQRFDAEFAALSPDAFTAEVLVGALGAVCVVIGAGFRFGAGRGGDFASLRAAGARLGFEVIAAPLVTDGGEGVSSTRIRAALLAGEVASARRLLGRPYAVEGDVVHGRGEGEGLGFPTANVGGVRVLLPRSGIYAARCTVRGAVRPAAVYLGDRPTLGHGLSLEAHLLDFDGDLYGDRITIAFVDRVRGDMRFDDVDALRAQMTIDVSRIRSILEADRG
ncbi:MAG: bifunctional riboflavin kinase/FAD synthetase [Proteobacteria bacterium]|jgi:riboflavin kinase/FMN adenylyltransferase|nr:bifunctional riboflavin kinase/FAD synthetase [Pseudomonadota bacterium]